MSIPIVEVDWGTRAGLQTGPHRDAIRQAAAAYIVARMNELFRNKAVRLQPNGALAGCETREISELLHFLLVEFTDLLKLPEPLNLGARWELNARRIAVSVSLVAASPRG